MGQNPHHRHKVKVSLRAERSNLCPKTEIASSLIVPRNDTLVSSVPLVVQSFVSRSLAGAWAEHYPETVKFWSCFGQVSVKRVPHTLLATPECFSPVSEFHGRQRWCNCGATNKNMLRERHIAGRTRLENSEQAQ